VNECASCRSKGTTLFYLPGAWDGGQCESCARTRAPQAFSQYFGVIRHVSDGDAGSGHASS
jgi:hypothetical protein